MKKALVMTCLAAALCFSTAAAEAQMTPDPVDLNISNLKQQNPSWYWPALAQQILNGRIPGEPPSQCQLVNTANEAAGRAESDCCANPELEVCGRPGELREIMALLGRYGIRSELVTPPATPEDVYQYLVAGRALIVGFKLVQDEKSHAYLVRGISWVDGEARLLVNDPAVPEPSTVPFADERPAWREVLAID